MLTVLAVLTGPRGALPEVNSESLTGPHGVMAEESLTGPHGVMAEVGVLIEESLPALTVVLAVVLAVQLGVGGAAAWRGPGKLALLPMAQRKMEDRVEGSCG